MKRTPFLVLLSLAALLAPTAACTCSGGQAGTGATAGQAATGSTAAATAAPTMVDRSFKLANGLQVDLVSGPCGEGAALAVLVGVGVDHDPPGRSGMARLAGRVLATSTPAGRAERTVETGGDHTLYAVVASGDRLLGELDEVAAWMSKTAPTEEALGRERAKMLEELGKLAGADAAMTAASLAEEAVLPARGNGKRHGIAKEVEAITLAELQGFWEAHLRPGNARITVAGRLDVEKVRAHIEAAFGALPAGTPPVQRDPGTATVRGTLVMGSAPTAVAVAIPAPAPSDPLFAPFLVLAARLAEAPAQPRTWEVHYDPLRRPDLLLITGPVGQAEQPEPAAGRIRSEVAAILARPAAPEEAAGTRERFRLFLEPKLVDPELCAKDTRAFATARARRAQLGIDVEPIAQALDAVSKEQLEDAARLFETKRTAAVIAGGTLP